MKKTILTITTALMICSATYAQTFVGSINSWIYPVQFSSTEFGFYSRSNDSLIIYNDDLTIDQTIVISLNGFDRITTIDYISKQLVDQDNGIEFFIAYADSNSYLTKGFMLYDNGTYSTLPNFTVSGQGEVRLTIRNTDTGSQLLVQENSTTYLYNLIGQALKIKEYGLKDMVLAPNPSSEIVRVPVVPGEVVSVYDMSGKVVKQENSSGHGHVLEVNDMPSGNYIIQGSNGGNWKFLKP